jgi:hypothetical protein
MIVSDWDGDHIEIVVEDKDECRVAVCERSAWHVAILETEKDEIFAEIPLADPEQVQALIDALAPYASDEN